ncbi:unnamed protein product, partial [Ilex paraguariensis]
ADHGKYNEALLANLNLKTKPKRDKGGDKQGITKYKKEKGNQGFNGRVDAYYIGEPTGTGIGRIGLS